MVSKQQQQQRFLFFQVSFFESRCLGFKKGKNSRQKKIFLFEGFFVQRRNILRATAFEWMDGSRNEKKGAIEERTTTIRRLSLVRLFFSRHRGGRSERARFWHECTHYPVLGKNGGGPRRPDAFW